MALCKHFADGMRQPSPMNPALRTLNSINIIIIIIFIETRLQNTIGNIIKYRFLG